MSEASGVIVRIKMPPDELYAFLIRAVAGNPKLRVLKGDENARRAKLVHYQSDSIDCYFEVAISYDNKISMMHFTAMNEQHSKALANAVGAVTQSLVSYHENNSCP